MTHAYVWHDPFICVTWPFYICLVYMCDMSHSHEWHDTSMRVTWSIQLCDMTLLHVYHVSYIYASYVSFTWVTWLMPRRMHTCNAIHSNPRTASMGRLRLVGSLKLYVSFAKRALWTRLYSAKETYNFKEPLHRSHPIQHSSMCHDSVTRWHEYKSYMWHDSSQTQHRCYSSHLEGLFARFVTFSGHLLVFIF